jgi:hypothetical protein
MPRIRPDIHLIGPAGQNKVGKIGNGKIHNRFYRNHLSSFPLSQIHCPLKGRGCRADLFVADIAFDGYTGDIGRAWFNQFNKPLWVFRMPQIPVVRVLQDLISDIGDPAPRHIRVEKVATRADKDKSPGP